MPGFTKNQVTAQNHPRCKYPKPCNFKKATGHNRKQLVGLPLCTFYPDTCNQQIWIGETTKQIVRVRHNNALAEALAKQANINVEYFKHEAVKLARKLHIQLPTTNLVKVSGEQC